MTRHDQDGATLDVFRAATAHEAMRRAVTVAPDKADAAAERGRARFFDALAGRYGLPGSIFPAAPFEETGDPTRLTVDGVRALARRFAEAGALDRDAAGVLGLDFGGLDFAATPVFQRSPLGLFAQAYGDGGFGVGRTWDWLATHHAQHRFLVAEGGDPAAIAASEQVLHQLEQLRAERAFYAVAFDADANRNPPNRGHGHSLFDRAVAPGLDALFAGRGPALSLAAALSAEGGTGGF